jgi:hypothetical protein
MNGHPWRKHEFYRTTAATSLLWRLPEKGHFSAISDSAGSPDRIKRGL